MHTKALSLQQELVIASRRRSNPCYRLPRRFAPRNDGKSRAECWPSSGLAMTENREFPGNDGQAGSDSSSQGRERLTLTRESYGSQTAMIIKVIINKYHDRYSIPEIDLADFAETNRFHTLVASLLLFAFGLIDFCITFFSKINNLKPHLFSLVYFGIFTVTSPIAFILSTKF